MRHFAAALKLAIFMTLLPSAAQAQEPASLRGYQGVVAQALEIVQASGTEPLRERLGRAASLLREVREVRLESGERIPVDNSRLALELEALEDAGRAAARLRALLTALEEAPAPVGEADLAKLRDVLGRAPFDQESNWLVRMMERIEQAINRFFANAVRGVFDLRDLIALVGVAAVGLVSAFLVMNLRRNLAAEQTLPGSPGAAPATSRSALDQAQRFAQGGDYRSAVRQLYLAMLLLLDERGMLRFDRSQTNREYLQAVAHNPPVAAALGPIVETFDRVWYGYEPIGEEEFQAYRREVERISRQKPDNRRQMTESE